MLEPEKVVEKEQLRKDRGKVPLLRGKINIVFFLVFPLVSYLFVKYDIVLDKLSFIIFLTCAAFNYLSSIILHCKIWDQELYSILRKIDYAGIFLMIGGCGLPAYTVLMSDNSVIICAVFHYIVLFIGVFSSLIYNFCYTSKPTRSIVYVLSSLPYFFVSYQILFKLKSTQVFLILLLGGTFYLMGAIVYGSKFPNLVPGVFEYHELFHVFCILGFTTVSISHFLLFKSGGPNLFNQFLQAKVQHIQA
uniref:Haemolysin-III related, putative n=1 Tax=Theileria annulata TaxID=5874 RepID=A0A3B0NJH5_THEAN